MHRSIIIKIVELLSCNQYNSERICIIYGFGTSKKCFKCLLKVFESSGIFCKSIGKLFQNFGVATWIHRSPRAARDRQDAELEH